MKGEQCYDCGRFYKINYMVPNDVWKKIAPMPETLGPYLEHQYGGLLCLICADQRARDVGITLYFDARMDD